jgi:nitrite reductase (NADH) small subunit
MSEVEVGSIISFDDPGRRVFEVNGREVGVYRLGDEFFAWENRCPHMQGPVCLGVIVPKAEESLDDQANSSGRHFSKTAMHLACPWHGFEFDIRTGRHPTNQKLRLRSVPLRISDGIVLLSL